eukprot:TRINITY_DN3839_c0_g1_i2.p1 TRINITY_DN3839_c0_g1~~TRINITY_DN3839_c0_g1_i2.p1  ORF type:complete len:460 (+),score=71.66 TRINITY_DN3839_c0_g1_i2:38-1417(+)
MNYVIPKSNLRIFHKALQSLSKVGGEIYFEPGQSQLMAKTINSRKTAFFVFCFKAGFFSSINGNIQQQQDSESNPLRCKLQLKSILLAFHSVVNTEKTVESCILEFKKDCYQVFITKNCRYQVCQKFTLPTLDHDTLKIDLKNTGSNYWIIHSKNLTEIASIFRQNLDEVTMTVSPDGFQLKTFVYSHEEKDQVNTEQTIEVEEFEQFHIEENASLTFNLKELRSLMLFGEAVGLSVKANFSEGGQPITFTLAEEPVLEVTYVLATMPDENSDTIRLMTTPRPQSVAQSRVPKNGAMPGSAVPATTAAEKIQRHSTQNLSSRDQETLPLPSATPIPPPPIVITETDQDDSQRSNASRNGRRLTSQNRPSNIIEDVATNDTSRVLGSRREGGGSKKRKSDLFDLGEGEQANGDHSVIQSPTLFKPVKRPKLFERCFEVTYNPNLLLPGQKILAPDSDDEK